MVYHVLGRRTNVRQETPLGWTKSQKKYKRRIHVKKRKDVRNKKTKYVIRIIVQINAYFIILKPQSHMEKLRVKRIAHIVNSRGYIKKKCSIKIN